MWAYIFNGGDYGESPSKRVKVFALDLIWTLKAALVAHLAALVALLLTDYYSFESAHKLILNRTNPAL